ncbi:hypothetical protein PAXRUDRAFT_686996 [Paxillus rubicundulus Ve08.2h10]|uniref:Uncharacterized protein n=1 Tax=Paxillus rubicundulus Ve08.2h10 TaxID=930991 RepID=A0A0D0EBY5_9AGAM|nr:hypothetical protein PAXRUDRAFT_686996 [Paxillus rubicundulus Ve08.2h10]
MHGPLRGPPITLSSYLLTLVHSVHSRAIHLCPCYPNYYFNSTSWTTHHPVILVLMSIPIYFLWSDTCYYALVPPPGNISPGVIHPKPCHLLHISTHCHTILHNLSNSLLFSFFKS